MHVVHVKKKEERDGVVTVDYSGEGWSSRQ
jgi:hypothetical protein